MDIRLIYIEGGKKNERAKVRADKKTALSFFLKNEGAKRILEIMNFYKKYIYQGGWLNNSERKYFIRKAPSKKKRALKNTAPQKKTRASPSISYSKI